MRCFFLTENVHHRLNARRVTADKDTSSFNVTGALNHFRSGQNSAWADQTERKPTVTMQSEIISEQVSDRDKMLLVLHSNTFLILNRM